MKRRKTSWHHSAHSSVPLENAHCTALGPKVGLEEESVMKRLQRCPIAGKAPAGCQPRQYSNRRSRAAVREMAIIRIVDSVNARCRNVRALHH